MPIVLANQLTKIYREKDAVPVHALDSVSLEIEPGEFTALVGPSGSGKTTLLNIIGGLDTPTEGSVEVDGKNLGTLNKRELAAFRLHHLGFVFQAYNLVPVLTAEENVAFTLLLRGVDKQKRQNMVRDELEALGIEKELHRRRPHKLSGGQQQRVAVARATVGEPKLILADEPTANLDSTTGKRLLDKMKSMNEQKGITFIFSTHDPLVMERANRIVHLRDGKIIEDKRP
ncbi:MAG: ABC transporter ATP-binding protein [Acidobacteria bacterium]|nr:ABC transporter ATP-binding protein [Acidobacteriota bacterium]